MRSLTVLGERLGAAIEWPLRRTALRAGVALTYHSVAAGPATPSASSIQPWTSPCSSASSRT